MIDKQKILNKVISTYGSVMQQVVAMEELSEFQKEVSKQIRGKGSKSALTEEMADVLIMIEQLMIIHNISVEDIDNEIKFKLIRINGVIDN